jgi:3-deoxy-manno-octulosonate cytidylyltransferase (CMP-KDO synthetase)
VNFPFKVIIPARFASTRLPGKPLVIIDQKTLIEHVYESALQSAATRVIIATDDDRIEDVARSFGATVVMTSATHQSGTDRINEVLTKLEVPEDEIIVNVQGDEYGLSPELINQVAAALHNHPDRHMATLCERIHDNKVYTDPNSVKVVMDSGKLALYFSRSPIPWMKSDGDSAGGINGPAYKHIGIYAYRSGFLKIFARLPRTHLEQQESLEQLRALHHGYRIHVEEVPRKTGIEINTEEDLELARKAGRL